jgi:hypothetical protein
MRFTPIGFLGSQTGNLSPVGGVTGSFTSGGVNYAFNKFTTSGELVLPNNIEATLLVVAGGASGIDSATQAGVGGGGGGVLYTETRLYKGRYNVSVGLGGISGSAGQSSSLSNTGFKYEALGGGTIGSIGNSGAPTSFNVGASITEAAGGGAGASQNGFDYVFITTRDGGKGGEGLTYNMDGTSSVYGSGGGGGGSTDQNADGGIRGTNAGDGYQQTPFGNVVQAINGYGGGGGGCQSGNLGPSGPGGSGVVIIRYQIQ